MSAERKTIRIATRKGQPPRELPVHAEQRGLVLHEDPSHPELLTLTHANSGFAVCPRLPKSKATKLLKAAGEMFDWSQDKKGIEAQIKANKDQARQMAQLCKSSTASTRYVDNLPSSKTQRSQSDADFEVRLTQARAESLARSQVAERERLDAPRRAERARQERQAEEERLQPQRDRAHAEAQQRLWLESKGRAAGRTFEQWLGLHRLAGQAGDQAMAMLQSFSGADQADSERHLVEARLYRAIAEGQSFDEAFAAADADYRRYAIAQQAKVAAAPKITRGPSSGHSVINHRWVPLDAMEHRKLHERFMVERILGAP